MTANQARILLVDDLPANLNTLSRALAAEYELSVVTSGAGALSLAQQITPDLILLDVMMPEMDGLETLRRLRASEWGRDIPVILITADDRTETQVSGLEQGANDFIVKPVVVPVVQVRVRNLLARQKAELQLRQAASVFEYANEGIMITDDKGVILDVNQAFTLITGHPREQVLGQTPRMFRSGHHDENYYQTMWQQLNDQGHWSGETWNRRSNGETYAVLQTISAVLDNQGRVVRYVALFSDITDLKEHQQQLEQIAHYDPLTGLPNRMLLADRMQQAMAHARRSGEMLAVGFMDLDGFKPVNDQFGHDAGDAVLREVARRMQQCIRAADTAARLGGDEFVLLLGGFKLAGQCQPSLQRLLDSLAEPLDWQGHSIRVSGSLGVVFYRGDDTDADLLLRRADQAMYLAKQQGKNRFHIETV